MILNDYEYIRELKAFRVYRYCPSGDCSGIMVPTGKVLTVYPVKYEHQCNGFCKTIQNYEVCYPKIVYEEI